MMKDLMTSSNLAVENLENAELNFIMSGIYKGFKGRIFGMYFRTTTCIGRNEIESNDG
ncbi:MAG: hypothetical protein Q4Q17_03985 [Tissierellia bacterium]|nr:hypothetical protein [Tissierellia bacterium]